VRLIAFLWILILLTTACGSNPASPSGTADPVILVSTTFLADITRNVAGDLQPVSSLLPFGADPHSYQPIPQDVAKIEHSKLLITNGANYEHFLGPLLENAGGQREVVEASAGINPRKDAQGMPIRIYGSIQTMSSPTLKTSVKRSLITIPKMRRFINRKRMRI